MRLRGTYDWPNTTAAVRMGQSDPAWLSEGLEVKEAKLADKAYFSVKEFKDRLGVSSNLIYEQLRKGALPSVRLGGRILIPADALQQMMERQGQQETPAEGD